MKKLMLFFILLFSITGCRNKEIMHVQVSKISYPAGKYLISEQVRLSAVISNPTKSNKELFATITVLNSLGNPVYTNTKILAVLPESQNDYTDSWIVSKGSKTGRYRLKLTVLEVLQGDEKNVIYQSSNEDTFICYANQDNFDDLKTSFWEVSDKTLGRTTFSPKNIKTADGKLVITLPAGGFGGGEILSHDTKGYGIYEVRMKLPNVPSSITGFFMYHPPDFYHEIDIEVYNDIGGTLLLTTYAAGKTSNEYRGKTGFDPTAEFHDYRFEYTPEEVAFYVDDKFIKTWNSGITKNKMNLMLNCWYPSWLNGSVSKKDQYLYVDWIRY